MELIFLQYISPSHTRLADVYKNIHHGPIKKQHNFYII